MQTPSPAVDLPRMCVCIRERMFARPCRVSTSSCFMTKTVTGGMVRTRSTVLVRVPWRCCTSHHAPSSSSSYPVVFTLHPNSCDHSRRACMHGMVHRRYLLFCTGRIEKFMVRYQKHRVRFENGETEDVDFKDEKVKVRCARAQCVCCVLVLCCAVSRMWPE